MRRRDEDLREFTVGDLEDVRVLDSLDFDGAVVRHESLF